MTKEDKTHEAEHFKVVDKRHASESSAENDSTVDQSRDEKAAAAPSNRQETASTERAASDARVGQGQDEHDSAVDFPSFVISLATQALVMLGEVPHPETNLVAKNIPAARQTIDILAMIEEKTKGNLSDDEKQLLEEVLSSLRLTFVRQISGQGRV
jgi:hypothetical protein